jgi:putative Mg2+ transporter-C (MgtC) family protein
MQLLDFVLNVGSALLMGVAIGLERQWRQHPAGLRTNALVCVGAALFVSLSKLLADDGTTGVDPTRMASYIVSGIGFLGGGVILREGLNVKGMATAATLWCSAAVGTLAGSGFRLAALIGAAFLLGTHLALRPIALWIDAQRKTAADVETTYRMRVTCAQQHEVVVRTILMRHVNSHATMTLQGLSTQDAPEPDHATVVAQIYSRTRDDRAMEEILSRVNIEPSVTAASWERVT